MYLYFKSLYKSHFEIRNWNSWNPSAFSYLVLYHLSLWKNMYGSKFRAYTGSSSINIIVIIYQTDFFFFLNPAEADHN